MAAVPLTSVSRALRNLHAGFLKHSQPLPPPAATFVAMAAAVPVHPAADNHNPHAAAIAYAARSTDPYPTRPREVICELMEAGVSLAPNCHVNIAQLALTEATFLSRTRALVSAARNGQIITHMGEARNRGAIPHAGNVSALQLYRWGSLFSTPACVENVNTQLQTQRLAARAPAGFTAQDQGMVNLHQQLSSKYAAERSTVRAKHQLLVDAAQKQLDTAVEAMESSLAEIADAWLPVSSNC